MSPHRPRLRELPPGAIRPTGWLADQLRLQADGQTGRLEEIWPDVGPDSGWLGGPGESWERGPYYLDGLIPLAYVLDDEALRAKVQRWVEAILASQRPDGQFGPAHPVSSDEDDWWPRMVACKALIQYADATGDDRVDALLGHYFAYQAAQLPIRPLTGWGRARGADSALAVLWLHRRTGQQWLFELAAMIIDQTEDWSVFLLEELPPGPVPTFRHLVHGVNVAMGLKTVAVAALVGDLDPGAASETTARMFAALDRLHGLVHGVFSGDEWLGGRDPHHGVETWLVVELMYTLEQLVAILGEGRYGDLLETTAYNLLAAANDPRMLAHQYHQQANQVSVSFEPRDWSFSGPDANVFGLEPHFGCCTANLHQGWPKLVRSLWMQTDDALVAVAYGPCSVSAEVDGRPIRLDVATDYPFEEQIAITVGTNGPVTAAVRLRIPAWCGNPGLQLDGVELAVEPDPDGYVELRRTWHGGEVITLRLPMRLRVLPRDRGAIGLRLGPLVMVNGAGEIWRDVPGHRGLAEWEISARSHWNLGLWLDDPAGPDVWSITRRPVSAVPFERSVAPVEIEGRGIPLRDWKVVEGSAPLPESPVGSSLPVLGFPLVPYGSARIRIAEFPVAIFTGLPE